MKILKVLIIGGNRYVGKRLTDLITQSGHELTLFNRHSQPQPNLRIINGDRRELKDLQKITGHYDTIYDFACFDAKEARLAVEFFQDKTPHYIFISSLSVYGPGGNQPEKNFDPWTFVSGEEVTTTENYALAKQQAEVVFYQQSQMKVTSIRFPIILGPDDYTGRLQWHVDKIKNEEAIFFPNINGEISFIHADDGAAALLHLLNHLYHGPLNVASPHPITLNELIRLIETKYNKKLISAPPTQNHSPFGISSDWWMNCDRLNNLGFTCREVAEWLPVLI